MVGYRLGSVLKEKDVTPIACVSVSYSGKSKVETEELRRRNKEALGHICDICRRECRWSAVFCLAGVCLASDFPERLQ